MEKNTEYLEKLVHINRITKVVKGGRRFGFSALVVVGNQNGKIGIAHAKAKQVPDAIKKANEMARRNLKMKNKTDLSKAVAERLAKKAQEKKITKVYFDRGRYKFHGRIKIFADTLRKGGLNF